MIDFGECRFNNYESCIMLIKRLFSLFVAASFCMWPARSITKSVTWSTVLSTGKMTSPAITPQRTANDPLARTKCA